jgi:putative salt-induced outer membrane protein YdiY
MLRCFLRVALMLVLMCGVASAAAAQAQPSPTAPPAAAPKKVTGMIAAALSLETGSTDLFSTTVSLNASMRHSAKTTTTLDFLHMHVSSQLPGMQSRTTLNNSQVAHLKFEHDAADRVVVLVQTTGTLDEVRNIQRVEELVGVGLTAGRPQKAYMRVIPVVAATLQDKNLELEEHAQFGVGVSQDLTYQLNPTWSVSQKLLYRHYFGNDADYAMEASASLMGKITTRLGLQVSFIHNYENLVMPGTLKRYQKLQVGLSYSF